MGHFGRFGGYQKWHLGCPNQNSKTTVQYKYPLLNPHLDFLGTILDPGKVIFGHFIYFGHFPIEIPMHLQICIFRPQGVLKSKKFQKKPTLKFNFTLKNMWGSSSNFKLTFRLKSHWALAIIEVIDIDPYAPNKNKQKCIFF